MNPPPLISIVVPTLNQARFIEQTLASIAGQNWPRTEILVIDGGSTDGTREIVERYANVVTHFLSEPDRGQADAINKGFRLARGDILAWLNSDDYYLPLALQRAATALGDVSQPRLVHGSVLLLLENEDRGRIARAHAFPREQLNVSSCIYPTRRVLDAAALGEDRRIESRLSFRARLGLVAAGERARSICPLDECLAGLSVPRSAQNGQRFLAAAAGNPRARRAACFGGMGRRLSRCGCAVGLTRVNMGTLREARPAPFAHALPSPVVSASRCENERRVLAIARLIFRSTFHSPMM
jgi:hypothetical protein